MSSFLASMNPFKQAPAAAPNPQAAQTNPNSNNSQGGLTPATAQQQASQNNQVVQGQQPNGSPTPNNQTNGTNTVPNPLDIYNTMYQNDPNKKDDVPPSFTLDPAVVGKVAGSLNFFEGIPQELMQKANSGDIASMMEVMQYSNRNAYQQALTHSSALTDKFVGQREDHFRKGVPGVVRDELTIGALAGNGEGGAMHPVVRKQLTEVAKLMQKANPDASPQEIAASARKYIKDMNDAINPAQVTPEQQNAAKQAAGTDWDAYFDAE